VHYLKDILGLNETPDAEISAVSEAVCADVLKAVSEHPAAVSQMKLLTFIVGNLLRELIKTNPQCPCSLVSQMAKFMTTMAVEHRFNGRPTSLICVMGPHQDAEIKG
jgi:hypothetical protein